MSVRSHWKLLNSSTVFLVGLLLTLVSVSGAQSRPPYIPDPKLTPGEALTTKREDVCGDGRRLDSKSISMDMKRRVFDRYGIGPNAPGAYDVEHLIPQRLGGSGSINNLWPQPMTGDWNHAMKDRLERKLHKLVCRGVIDLKTAQQEIVADWTKAYKKYIGEPTEK